MRSIILFCLVSSFGFSQGPIDGFFKGKGNADIAVGMGVNRSTNYTGHPDSLYDQSYGAEQVGLFAQYGITANLDAVFSLPFVFGAGENKFQDMGLHVKYRPLKINWNKNEWSTLFAGGVSFPASDYQADISGALGRRTKKIPLRMISQVKLSNGLFFNITGSYFIRFDRVKESVLTEYQTLHPSHKISQPFDHYSLMSRIGYAGNHNFVELFVQYQNTLDGIDFKQGVEQPIQLYEVDYLKVGGTYYYGKQENGVAVNIAYIPGLRRNIGNIIYAGVSFILKYREH